MSLITLIQKDLQAVLGICNQISTKKDQVEIFNNLKILISGSQFQISCINNNMFYTTTLQGNSQSEEILEFTISTEKLASAIALIGDENVSLEVDLSKHTLKVVGSRAKHTLRINTELVQNYSSPTPKTEEITNSIIIDSDELKSSLVSAAVSVGDAKNTYQPHFLNICFTVGEKVVLASTDGWRVTRIRLETAKTSEKETSLIEESENYLILPKGLLLVANNLNSGTQTEINFEKDFAWVKTDKGEFAFRYGSGKYPDYDRIIPSSFACNFEVDKGELVSQLKQVYFSARDNVVNRSVSFEFKPQILQIILTSESGDGYKSEGSVSITNFEGVNDDWTQSFNADYILGYINNLKTEILLWESNPGKPSVLSPLGQRDREIYLVSGLK
jgi:DNA polymerase-3 subunit beta